MWLQFDWGDGPTIAGRPTVLFCAWLAWSRFRVVLPTWDRTLPTLLGCLDLTLRRFGGAPTYALTDNEKTVTGGQRGRPQIRDEHYPADHPGRRALPGDRTPKATNPAEQAFLTIGDGAKAWLVEAAATGASRVRSKMAEAVTFAKLHGDVVVDQALGTAALAGRFAEHDLAAILSHQQGRPAGPVTRASEAHSLQPGTASWASFGAPDDGGERSKQPGTATGRRG